MGQVQVFSRTFLRGLETTREEGGQPDFSGFRIFKNIRVGKDTAERRPGMAVVGSVSEAGSAAVFRTGAGAIAHIDDKVWGLTGPLWCLDFFVRPQVDDEAGTLLDTGSIVVSQNNAVWEIDIGTAQLTTGLETGPTHLAVIRTADGYELFKAGVSVDTAAYAAPGALGTEVRLGEGKWDLDFLRLRTRPPANWRGRELRLLNPRAQLVLACYRDAPDSDTIFWDHSTYENHAISADPQSPGARLSPVPHAPVQGIGVYVDSSDRRHILVVADGQEWDAILA